MDNSTLEMFQTFLEEAGEHLEMIEDGLLELEKDNGNQRIINDIFRGIHSIKGGAGFFDLETLGELSHAMEELLSLARQKKLVFESQHVEILLKCLDILKHMLDKPGESNDIDISAEMILLRQYIENSTSPGEKKITAPQKKDVSSAGFAEFGIAPEILEKQIKQGNVIYHITINFRKDILDNGDNPNNYLNGLEKMGEILAALPEKIEELKAVQSLDAEKTVRIIFSTAMDPELAGIIFSLPEDQYKVLEVKDLVKPIQFVDKNNNIVSIAPAQKNTEESPKTESENPLHETDTLFPDKETETAKPKTDKNLKRNAEAALGEQETLRVKIKQLNKLVNLAGELVLSRNQLASLTEKHLKEETAFTGIVKNLSIIISDLQEQIMNTRMQPIAQICTKFPRIVRDLSKKLDKSVEFQLDGGEIELDKTIIEALTDPLTHLIRNVVDHGIEPPDERAEKGKHRTGSLLLKAFHESGQVIIEIKDDGRGINPEKIAAKALEKKLVDEVSLAAMSDREKIKLIFSPGFSTAEKVSDISGRGVGMDVVRTNIEKIGGTVELDSRYGNGTTVRMTLPLTLAIVSSLIVTVCGRKFILPQVNIEELINIEPEEAHKRIGKVQDVTVLKIRGKLLPLVYTSEILGFKSAHHKNAQNDSKQSLKVIVIHVGIQSIGLIVDEILGIEEIVVKPMPQFLRQMNFYSGCSILGDGSVALILDLLEIAKNLSVLIDKSTMEQLSISQVATDISRTGKVPLLIFSNGTDEQFAVPISLIERIEKFSPSRIQAIGHMEFTEHQGKSMRILRLEDYLNIQKPVSRNSTEPSIIVIKDMEPLTCLFIHRIIDSKAVEIAIEKETLRSPGIAGSILIDHKITILLDIPGFIQTALKGAEVA